MVEDIQITSYSNEPIYIQVREQLRHLIMSGRLVHGLQLPSLRELADQLCCSLITVRRVYLDLEHEGLLTPKKGVGTFVCYEPNAEEARQRSEKMLYNAFREAAQVGRRYQFSVEEMKVILETVLADGV
ncbi:MAG: GntR family transcriptional regulator [Paenibacillus sp.]|nr:GntR family transcriptional regulator [Paenibacillus sp.]